jgi:hypothetical protein
MREPSADGAMAHTIWISPGLKAIVMIPCALAGLSLLVISANAMACSDIGLSDAAAAVQSSFRFHCGNRCLTPFPFFSKGEARVRVLLLTLQIFIRL